MQDRSTAPRNDLERAALYRERAEAITLGVESDAEERESSAEMRQRLLDEQRRLLDMEEWNGRGRVDDLCRITITYESAAGGFDHVHAHEVPEEFGEEALALLDVTDIPKVFRIPGKFAVRTDRIMAVQVAPDYRYDEKVKQQATRDMLDQGVLPPWLEEQVSERQREEERELKRMVEGSGRTGLDSGEPEPQTGEAPSEYAEKVTVEELAEASTADDTPEPEPEAEAKPKRKRGS